jgi:protein gp37
MGQNSKIEWTDATWNPVRGCSRVSEGCRNCYAERTAARFAIPGSVEAGNFVGYVETVNGHPAWTGKVDLIESKLEEPLRWKKPRRVFVNSMSDLFHESLSVRQIARVFSVMAEAGQHDYQILTKRAERLLVILAEIEAYVREEWERFDGGRFTWPLPNVWLGVSVEDQVTADKRIPFLLQTLAAVRFVSYEPALGPVDFARLYGHVSIGGAVDLCVDALRGLYTAAWKGRDSLPDRRLSERGAGKLDWIIAGGESGPGARPASPRWFRDVRDQCAGAGVAFFFKQWGEYLGTHIFDPDGVRVDSGQGYATAMKRVGKKAAGAMLDGREWRAFPSVTAGNVHG